MFGRLQDVCAALRLSGVKIEPEHIRSIEGCLKTADEGTVEILKKQGIDPEAITEVDHPRAFWALRQLVNSIAVGVMVGDDMNPEQYQELESHLQGLPRRAQGEALPTQADGPVDLHEPAQPKPKAKAKAKKEPNAPSGA